MAQVVKIGNSQGVRIPKPLIEQAQIADVELTFKVLDEGLLITPKKSAREGWKEAIKEKMLSNSPEDSEWLDADLNDEENFEW